MKYDVYFGVTDIILYIDGHFRCKTEFMQWVLSYNSKVTNIALNNVLQ